MSDEPKTVSIKQRWLEDDIPASAITVERRTKQNRLFHSGGSGSGDFGHSGRPGEVGGSKSEASGKGVIMKRPTEKQIHTALEIGVYQVSEGVHIPLERVKYSVELVPVKNLVASETKKPSDELVNIYREGKQVQPISVRKVSYESKMKVLDGNHRLKAARLAGVDSVWVVAIEDW